MSMSVLAIIPARGGSKGIPGKNIKLLLGKPLIEWTIDDAKHSALITHTIVSTDDDNIASVARKNGIDVIKRPAELAQDTSPTIDVILHVLQECEKQGRTYDALVLLEPTSPLRDTADIDECLQELFTNPHAEAIVTVAPLESSHPDFSVMLNEHQLIRRANGTAEFTVLRRQDLEKFYFFEGTVYASYIKTIKEKKGFYHDKTMGHIVPRYKALEIDDPSDLIIAEALLKAKQDGTL